LEASSRFLDEHGETGEAQALREVVKALAARDGEYAESEAYLPGGKMLSFVAALLVARARGCYAQDE